MKNENSLSFFNLSSIKYLDRDQEYALALSYYSTGDISAAHALAVSHLPYVVKIANNYSKYFRIDLTELVQVGTIGLLKAIKSFNPYKGSRLADFAYIWIKDEIKDFIRDSWNLVKLGTTTLQRKLFFKVRDLDKYDEKTNENSINSLAKELNVSSDDVSNFASRVNSRDYSLNTPLVPGIGSECFLDYVVDASPNQEQEYFLCEEKYYCKKRVQDALSFLTDKERFIIEKRYMEDPIWTFQEIGDYLKVSKQRVSQLEKRVMVKLKDLLTEKGESEYEI